MKVLCERETLREALTIATSVIPNKSTRPAVENVFVRADGDALELVGTDLDVAVRYRVDNVKLEEPGTALVPARVASDFVRDLSGETVRLGSQGSSFLIESEDERCELTTIDPDEFPGVSQFGEGEQGSVSVLGATFSRLVSRTSFAAAREAGRYAMHGILVVIEDDELRMIATDGRRLALASATIDRNGEPLNQGPAIVPTKAMQLFCRVIDDPTEMVEIHFGENIFGLRTSKAEVFARLIDGDFPRYSAVVPSSTENLVEADAVTFGKKLKLVANVTSVDTRAVRISLEPGQMKILGRSDSTGEATAQLAIQYDGDPVDIVFNPDYLIDGIKNCETDVLRLEFNQRNTPGKFTLGENYTYIVMPITVDT
ncbi:MAG: DNA polymerase III subunit beta [Planctomycetes bacterium]|nr:DNA polymerase III subunit beta [Planctomycetota bacterium]